MCTRNAAVLHSFTGFPVCLDTDVCKTCYILLPLLLVFLASLAFLVLLVLLVLVLLLMPSLIHYDHAEL